MRFNHIFFSFLLGIQTQLLSQVYEDQYLDPSMISRPLHPLLF